MSVFEGGLLILNPEEPDPDLDIWYEIIGTEKGDRKRNMALVRLYLESGIEPPAAAE